MTEAYIVKYVAFLLPFSNVLYIAVGISGLCQRLSIEQWEHQSGERGKSAYYQDKSAGNFFLLLLF